MIQRLAAGGKIINAMSNPDGRPIEPKGSADVEMSGRTETTGRRCALSSTPRPGEIN